MSEHRPREPEPVPPLPRHRDEDALFNPAFVATVIAVAADAHHRAFRRRMPLEMAFLVPLLSLPASLRRELPGNAGAYLITWLDKHPAARPTLARIAPAHAANTRRGLRFGLGHHLLDLEPQGVGAGPALRRVSAAAAPEVVKVLDAAALVGRWLSRTGPPAAVYNALGLRP